MSTLERALGRPPVHVATHRMFSLEPFATDPLPTLRRGLDVLNAYDDESPLAYAHAGTALGLYRDGRILAHDSDLDVAVNWDWHPAGDMSRARAWAADMVRQFEDAGFELLRSVTVGGAPSQYLFADNERAGVKFDIEVYYSGIVPGMRVHAKESGYISVPEELVAATRYVLVEGLAVPVPQDTEAYLAYRYGADWRTPIVWEGPWEDHTPGYRVWRDWEDAPRYGP